MVVNQRKNKNPRDFAGVEHDWTLADVELNTPAIETVESVEEDGEELPEVEPEADEEEEE